MKAAHFMVGLAGCAAVVVAPSSAAQAHFILETPPASMEQGPQGDPQKTAPCGGSGTPTGAVTTYQAGQTIEITIDERITHPGHYRVALAVNDVSELPDNPAITPVGGDECGSTVIQDPPVFPVLADGMLEHSAAFEGPQTFEVKLPDDVTCENCTLQVIEYMSSHGAPCFYHHCANIAIQTEPVTTTTSGSGGSSGIGAGSDGDGGSSADADDGCAFAPAPASRSRSGWTWLAGLGAAVILRRGSKNR